MDIPVELEPKGLSSQDSVSPTCRMEVWPRGCWDLEHEAGEGGAPLAYSQGTWDPSMTGSRCPVNFSAQTHLGRGRSQWWFRPGQCPRLGEAPAVGAWVACGLWPMVSGSGSWVGFGGPRCCNHSRHAGKLVMWLAVGLQQTDFMSVCFCNTFL